MAEAITLPPGAFAAAKSGAPQPAPKPAAEAAPKPAAAKEAKAPEVVRRPAPSLRDDPPPKETKPEPVAEKPAETEAAAEKRIRKLKVAGQEREWDLANEEESLKAIAKGLGADELFRKTARDREEMENAIRTVQGGGDPKKIDAALRKLGIDPEAFSEAVVWETMQRKAREEEWAKDPAAKKRWDDDQELQQRRDADERARQDGLTEKQRQDQIKFESSYESKITKALDSGKIPKTPESVQRMADELYIAVENGIDLTAEEIVEKVRGDLVNDSKVLFGAMDGEQIIALLGEEIADKIRQADLKKLRSPQGNPFPVRSAAKNAASQRNEPAPKEKRVSGSEWRDGLVKGFLSRQR